MILKHICETCGKVETLDIEEGYNKGWDYPPKMYKFGVISPRTCPCCSITTTLWWELEVNKTPIKELSSRHKNTLKRILEEPNSIKAENN